MVAAVDEAPWPVWFMPTNEEGRRNSEKPPGPCPGPDPDDPPE